jgi:RNA polymerase sigma factor (sigma-70 family)
VTNQVEPSAIRVLLADDDVLMRSGLRMLLEASPGIEIVGEAGDVLEAVAMVEALRPHVVLMDIRMPQLDGIEATARIVAAQGDPSGGSDTESTAANDGADGEAAEAEADEVDADEVVTRVLVLTTFELDEYVYDAVLAGASGFLLKRTPPEEVVAGIRAVASGDALLAPSVTRRLLEDFVKARSGRRPLNKSAIDRLTPREAEVLVQMAKGLSNQEIAQELFVSEGTVKTHVKRILMKLALRDRVQAVVFAYENGLVGGNDEL